jgi:dsRNA-specific ribonuclease
LIGAIYLDSDLDTVQRFIFEKIYTKKFQFWVFFLQLLLINFIV